MASQSGPQNQLVLRGNQPLAAVTQGPAPLPQIPAQNQSLVATQTRPVFGQNAYQPIQAPPRALLRPAPAIMPDMPVNPTYSMAYRPHQAPAQVRFRPAPATVPQIHVNPMDPIACRPIQAPAPALLRPPTVSVPGPMTYSPLQGLTKGRFR